ncbi:hypothetical protein K435DRAFT_851606 [Dendrothele bispora CBS 962.96]|uniref:Uncharacterized protein n=1 Tax=Dendrothele bispora (strain CBS 962.96) TaxID=1314807 RepID=A0A4S8MLB5_DENBC|nr:hypothetical protein K435DRAFT_851606 [Dendrothele bispora CBS 962.96]
MNPNPLFAITLITVIQQTTALSIKPLSDIHISTPVVVSWFRHDSDSDPDQWFFRKQDMSFAQGNTDYSNGASESLTVQNANEDSGEVTITFTVNPGTFRLLGIEEGKQNPFFESSPTINVLPAVPLETPLVTSSVTSTSSQTTPTTTAVQSSKPTMLSKNSNENDSSTTPTVLASGVIASSGSDFWSQSTSSTSTLFASQGDGTVSSPTKSADPLETNQGFAKDESHPTVAIISASIFGTMIVIILAVIYWFLRRRRGKPICFDREMMVRNKRGSDHGHRKFLSFISSKSRATSTLSDSGVKPRTSMSSYQSSWTNSSELSEGSFYEAPVIGCQSKQRGSITSKYYDEFPMTPTISTSVHSLRSSEETLNMTKSYHPPNRTDRQMFIQEKIEELQQQMASASNRGLSSAREVEALRATIKRWENMQSLEWALEID